jgi:hypothetical protein
MLDRSVLCSIYFFLVRLPRNKGRLEQLVHVVAALNECVGTPRLGGVERIRGFISDLSVAAERAIVVKVNEIEPDVDVFAQWIELLHRFGKVRERLMVAVRRALQMIFAPRCDFPRLALVFRIDLYPC